MLIDDMSPPDLVGIDNEGVYAWIDDTPYMTQEEFEAEFDINTVVMISSRKRWIETGALEDGRNIRFDLGAFVNTPLRVVVDEQEGEEEDANRFDSYGDASKLTDLSVEQLWDIRQKVAEDWRAKRAYSDVVSTRHIENGKTYDIRFYDFGHPTLSSSSSQPTYNLSPLQEGEGESEENRED